MASRGADSLYVSVYLREMMLPDLYELINQARLFIGSPFLIIEAIAWLLPREHPGCLASGTGNESGRFRVRTPGLAGVILDLLLVSGWVFSGSFAAASISDKLQHQHVTLIRRKWPFPDGVHVHLRH